MASPIKIKLRILSSNKDFLVQQHVRSCDIKNNKIVIIIIIIIIIIITTIIIMIIYFGHNEVLSMISYIEKN